MPGLPGSVAPRAYLGHVGITQDISRQKLTERELRESEARLTQAQHLARIGHVIWDEIDDRMAYRSKTVDFIWGGLPEEGFASFAEFLDTVHPDDRERVDVVTRQASKERKLWEIDYRIVRPDGETRFVQEIAEPEFDDTGRLVRTISTVQDVTDQRKTEEALRKNEMRYRELFDESPVGIWEADYSARLKSLGIVYRPVAMPICAQRFWN